MPKRKEHLFGNPWFSTFKQIFSTTELSLLNFWFSQRYWMKFTKPFIFNLQACMEPEINGTQKPSNRSAYDSCKCVSLGFRVWTNPLSTRDVQLNPVLANAFLRPNLLLENSSTQKRPLQATREKSDASSFFKYKPFYIATCCSRVVFFPDSGIQA